LTVFGAGDDALVAPVKLTGWRWHSADFTGFHLHGGGHFYLQRPPERLIRQIVSGRSSP
jgi:surfactin synthase thioesterase subunit